MLHSTDRILTTHVGSLPRNETLSRLLIDQEAGKAVDKAALSREAEAATAHVIAAQVKAGIDVGNDGEQSRVAFQTYVPRCMCGFGGEFEAAAIARSGDVSELDTATHDPLPVFRAHDEPASRNQ